MTNRTAPPPGAREGSSRRTLSDVAGGMLGRRVGRLTGDAGRAVGAIHTLLLLGLLATASYTAFYLTYDFDGLMVLVIGGAVAAVVYVLGLVLARLGYQRAASVIAFATPVAQVIVACVFLGWESGFHLYLLAGGQLVYVLLTERQRPWRWLWVTVSLAAFLYCQFALPAADARYTMPDVILASMFAINAVCTLGLLLVLAAFGHFRVTEARGEAAQAAAQAEYLAAMDPLTGLSTRQPVVERLATLAAASEAPYSVAVVDLDGFAALNERFGVECGDHVLAEVGARLRGDLRVSDSLGRWGSDEFLIVMPEAGLADASVTMERVLAAVCSEPVVWEERPLEIAASVGVAEGTKGLTVSQLVAQAGSLAAEAKAAGGASVRASSRGGA